LIVFYLVFESYTRGFGVRGAGVIEYRTSSIRA
jgi:hypothetical protein